MRPYLHRVSTENLSGLARGGWLFFNGWLRQSDYRMGLARPLSDYPLLPSAEDSYPSAYGMINCCPD